MRQHRQLFENIRARLGMYIQEETYAAVTALIIGYDLACEGGILVGFREWLVVRVNKGPNLSWAALVLHAAFPQANSPQQAVLANPESQRHGIDVLFRLLAEYEDVRPHPDGLKSVFLAFDRWLHQQGIEPHSPDRE